MVESVYFYFSADGAFMDIRFSEIDENPFFSDDDYYNYYGNPNVDCFLDHIVLRNNYTGEEFRPQDKGLCRSYSRSRLIRMIFSTRDHFRMVLSEFINNRSLPGGHTVLMYFDDPNQLYVLISQSIPTRNR